MVGQNSWDRYGRREVGNRPSKFVNFFRICRDKGFRITIHAGEEGPAAYVSQAVELLGVDRIDHGNACLSDQPCPGNH
ncbi:hypothetical protein [Bradyrhizobium sp. LTSPM299]|uniref:hypothetical protein n=1 Tax=Bradyrhizobium sp. LTSPM299 TaxID=1619233 RepID=UPI001FDA435F|nr:hypothetical protein [Bradyrhizobium sp. LTSPM299]